MEDYRLSNIQLEQLKCLYQILSFFYHFLLLKLVTGSRILEKKNL